MKKIKLFSALALALVMTSCDDFDLPNPPGQTNPDPEAYFADTDLALAPVSETLNLTEANAANKYVTVANITTFQNFPADYSLEIDMEVGNDVNFTKSTTIPTTIDGDAVTVDPAMLNGAIQSVKTKAPGTYDINSRLVAYATKGNTRLRLGGVDNYYLTEVVNVKTFDPEKVIENTYYIIPCDASGTPDWNGKLKMNNTFGEDAIGYDHPEFSFKVESPDPEGYYFMVASQSVLTAQDASQLLGGNPASTGLSGKLGSDYNVIHIEITGDILISINVEQDSYEFSYAFPMLYPYSGATQNANNVLKLYTDNYVNYSGVAAINNQWVINAYPEKTATPIFKEAADSETVISADGFSMSGMLSSGADATTLKTPVKGAHLFWVDVNLPQLTYSMTAINELSLIGAFNDWSHETSVDLKPEGTSLTKLGVWTVKDVELDGGFKIAANKSWDSGVDFGGVSAGTDDAGNLIFNMTMKGGDLNVEKGTYDVKLDFTSKPYVLTLTKK